MRTLQSLILYQSLFLPHDCVCSTRPDLVAGLSCLEAVGLGIIFTANRLFWWESYQIFHICETKLKNGLFGQVTNMWSGDDAAMSPPRNAGQWKNLEEVLRKNLRWETLGKMWMEQKGSEGRRRQRVSCTTQFIYPGQRSLKKGQSSEGSVLLLSMLKVSLAKLKALTSDQICGWKIFPTCVLPILERCLLI